MKILILCTGNSCRSQMAKGILRNIKPSWRVESAGTNPAQFTHPKAVLVMQEMGIDISSSTPRHANQFAKENWNYVITVCGDAEENCPVFTGQVKQKIHIGFFDPAKAEGSEKEILNVFRTVRDEIKLKFEKFAENPESF
ncbi:MAG: arsenate reductase ArsC [Spirochaetia bacterium]|nr:arsenate reductase ArsC [Spirochaetia bacterium]